MEFVLDLGPGALVLLIGGSLIFGVIAQFLGRTETGWEWLVDSIAAFVGALVASEFVIAWQAAGPVWDGLALIPALIGGLFVGVLADVATRYITGGAPFARHPAAV
jgi:uncharacterized membrane protein YeaQ/YmgE (transglycosylase-associated protein family)